MTTVPRRLAACAAARPDDIACLTADGSRLTYRAWDQRATRVARAMRLHGAAPGERIAIVTQTSEWLEYAIAYVAAQRAGCIAVPVPADGGTAYREWAVERAGAVAFVDTGPDRRVQAASWSATLAELEGAGGEQTDGPGPRDAVALDAGAAPDDPAEILRTSGTTGGPKCVVASHANVLAAHAASDARADRARHVLHCLPAATTAGQGLLVLPLHPAPHTVITLGQFDPAAFFSAIERHRPTDVVLVPALAIALIEAFAPDTWDLGSVRLVRTTSAPIAPATLARLDVLFPGAATVNMYSSTEAWPARTRLRFDPTRPGSVGRPAAGSSLRIVDADGRAVGPGEVGEVQLRAEGAPQRRYEGDDEASERVFLADGWVRTGDVGRLDADGFLHLLDRSSDLLNVGGVNVASLEVEAALHEHDAVVEAAVVGLPHPLLGERVAAAVRLARDVPAAELRAFVEHRLGAAPTPATIAVVDELPRNAAGKVLKPALRSQLLAAARSAPSAPPATATERTVARVWLSVLDVEDVGRGDGFLDLGGSSLSALEAIALVGEALGVETTVRDLFESETLEAYAERLERAPAAAADPAPPIERQPRGTR